MNWMKNLNLQLFILASVHSGYQRAMQQPVRQDAEERRLVLDLT